MRKVVGVLGMMSLLATAVVAFAVPAGAQTSYPPSACTLEVGGGEAQAGGGVDIFGSGFASDAVVPLSVNGNPAGDVTADPAGTFSAVVTIPEGTTSPVVVSAPGCETSFSLAAAGARRPLAFTGSDSSPLIVLGIVAVALGTALVFGARRRGATQAAVAAAAEVRVG